MIWRVSTALLFLSFALPACFQTWPSSRADDLGVFAEIAAEDAGSPPAAAILFVPQPLFEAIPGRTRSHAPTLTALPDGSLLAAWYSYVGPDELDRAAIYTARLRPGEPAWDPPQLLVERCESTGNPVLYSEGNRVWLFYPVALFGWSVARIELQESGDAGRTWSVPRVVLGTLGAMVRSPPIRATDGRLILPAYDDLIQRSLFLESADGRHWTVRSTLFTPPPHQNLQPSLALLSDGRLLAVIRNRGRGWLWASVSADAGRSWSPPQDSGLPNPGSAACLLRLSGGVLVLIFNDSPTDRQLLSLTHSTDDGRKWSAPRVLVSDAAGRESSSGEAGGGEYAYPAAIQSPDGTVHILYSHNRAYIAHLRVDDEWILQDRTVIQEDAGP